MHMPQNSVACIVYNRSMREGPWEEKNFRRAIALNFLYFYKESSERNYLIFPYIYYSTRVRSSLCVETVNTRQLVNI